ncbi:MAG TPA: hypothetical protein VGP16_07160, partial [Asanoa sp.]|nr:hypothetical protein [Asanoa sp.]
MSDLPSFRSLQHEDYQALGLVAGVIAREPVGFVSAQRYDVDLARRMFRPEWTWIAADDGAIVARAVWWGRPDSTSPLVLDCLWTDPRAGDRANLAGGLLAAAHRRFQEPPEAYRMTLRNDWRTDPATRDAVAWRRTAAATVG